MQMIDGSFGEGGGQTLRSSLALSMVTGEPVRLVNVRARRSKPGLRPQHLAAVRAAATVCGAVVEGDVVGSREITFRPGPVAAGDFEFSVGTAGSATLVFQTVLPALLCASGSSVVTLEGGTHNPLAPPFEFLANVFLPIVNRMGPRIEVALERHGFSPAGGGRFTARIEPADRLDGVELLTRGAIRRERAIAIISQLPEHIAERELERIRGKTNWPRESLHRKVVRDSTGPGNVVMIEVESDAGTELFAGFGERGVRAESVADRVVRAYRRYVEGDVPVGEHLADQLLLPMALSGSGAFRTLALSNHTTTHIELLRRLAARRVSVEAESDDTRLVRFD
jgi:RNA 3'-terminal phosphate cyclase (ATP)